MASLVESYPSPLVDWIKETDPSTQPLDRLLRLRTISRTNTSLQRIASAERLAYWGSAAALVLDYYAHHPSDADFDLFRAPRVLVWGGGDRRPSTAANGVLCLPTAAGLALSEALATETSLRPGQAASLFLHMNAVRAARAFSQIQQVPA